MKPRFWIFLAGLFGASAVVAGAVGAHALPGGVDSALRDSYRTAQLYHLMHAIALLGVTAVMLQSEGRRTGFASYALQTSAAAFTIGIFCFSGGIYAEVGGGFTAIGKVIPFGGMCFIAGWTALAIGALGSRG